MQEDRRLRYLCLPQFFLRPGKHSVRDPKTENIIGLLEQFLGKSTILIKTFTHSWKLRSLSREHICMLHSAEGLVCASRAPHGTPPAKRQGKYKVFFNEGWKRSAW